MLLPGIGNVHQKEVLYYYDGPLVWIAETNRDELYLVADLSPQDTIAIKLESSEVFDRTIESLFYNKLLLHIRYSRNNPPRTSWISAHELPCELLREKSEIFIPGEGSTPYI